MAITKQTSVPTPQLGEHASTLAAAFDRYHQEIYRLCLGILGDAHEAEDATQETFLAACRAWASYDPERAAVRTWLGQIAVNHCRSQLRRQRLLAPLLRMLGRHEASDPSAAVEPDLLAALRALDEGHRLVVVLRYYMGYSCAEIATLLLLSEGTVHSRLFTGRQRLRAALAPQGEGARDG